MNSNISASRFFIFIFIITFFNSAFANSFFSQFKTFNQDTNKVNELNELVWKLKMKNTDTCFIIQKQALDMAIAIKWTKGEAQAHHQFGILYNILRDYENSLKHNELALKCWELLIKSKNRSESSFGLNGKGKTISNMGHTYKYQSDFANAIKYYLIALKIMEETNNLVGIATINGNLGALYSDQGEYEKAQDYLINGLAFARKTSNKQLEANTLTNLGRNLNNIKEEKKAIEYSLEAEKIYQDLSDKYGLINVYNNLGVSYARMNDNKKYHFYLGKGLDLLRTSAYPSLLAKFYNNTATYYESEKEYNKALLYTDSAELIGADLNDMDLYWRIAKIRSDCYLAKSDYQNAYVFYKKFIHLWDSLNNMDAKKKQMQVEMNYQYEKKEAISKAEFDKKQALSMIELEKKKFLLESKQKEMALMENENKMKELTLSKNQTELKQKETEAKAQQKSIELLNKAKLLDQAELTAKRNQQYFLYGGLIIVLLFSGIIFNRLNISNRQKKLIDQQRAFLEKQKNLISEKHKEITDSINYAERIQRSFLATKELLDENLNDHFVFFQPKEVVSGDFYWASKLNDGNFAIVTADSTGHGVPGAIMSLLNITSLESAIKDGGLQPGEILNSTRHKIIDRLKKDGSEEGGKDGMDASLICFDFDGSRFTYAAANNPIWIIRDKQLIELKPDKMPIGKHSKDSEPFTQQEYKTLKGDVIYTLTDGMPDQFGGPKGKKYMYKQLKELLVSISHYPMEQQKQFLEKTLNNWKGDLEQVDDVTIIGVRV